MITLKVGICRKEGTDGYGSVGATCEVEGIELPSEGDPAAIFAVQGKWLAFCERTVNDEIHRLKGARAAAPAPAANGHGQHFDEFAPSSAPAPESRRPERLAQAGATAVREREPGDDDEEIEEPAADEKVPANGRQLLGWAGDQEPDAMPAIKSWGAAKRIKAKIVDWTPEQVRKAYLHVRGTAR